MGGTELENLSEESKPDTQVNRLQVIGHEGSKYNESNRDFDSDLQVG